MNQADYAIYDRRVENRIQHANGAWFNVGWDGMVTVCEDKVTAGTLEKRFIEDKGRLEFRAL